MISLLVTTDGQPQMEMAMIGREGVIGASENIQEQGSTQPEPGPDTWRVHCGLRPTHSEKYLSVGPAVERLIHQHLLALMRQILHGAAWNRLHSMEERCARWLLMTHNRASRGYLPADAGISFPYARRQEGDVNVATGMLKKAGFIRYVRGKMTVIDRAGLESASCECYQAIIRVYNSILPDVSRPER